MNVYRRIVIRAVFIVGLSVCVLPLAQAKEPKSWPLWCKGGDNFTLQVVSGFDRNVQIRYTFKKGKRGTKAGALQPGECSWEDRGLRANEPDNLSLEFPGAILQTNIRRMNDKEHVIFQYGGSKDELARFIETIRGGDKIQLYVYSDRNARSWSNGSLKVTKIGKIIRYRR